MRLIPRKILFRTALASWVMIGVTVSMLALFIVPGEKNALITELESKAGTMATSIDHMTATAIVTEDYSSVVDLCMRVVRERPSITYLVIARQDGFSLISTSEGWRREDLSGTWIPQDRGQAVRGFVDSELVGDEVYHYAHPFSYSGIDWGWIHVGLSLENYKADVGNLYRRALLAVFLCMLAAFVISWFFARRLSGPILFLDEATRKIAAGDLSARARICTGDEMESLAHSLNTMAENLQNSQRELAESARTFRAMVETSQHLIWTVDVEGRFTYVNPACLDTYGYSMEEVLGRRFTRFIPRETLRRDMKQLGRALSGESVLGHETTHRTKRGKNLHLVINAVPVLDACGEIVSVQGAVYDITTRVEAEADREKLSDQLRQKMKMEAIGKLAGGVAHDFNNLLQVISGRASLLLDQVNGQHELKEGVVEISNAASRAASLTRQLLAYSRQQVLQFERIDLRQVMTDLVKMIRRLIGEHIRLEVLPGEKLWPIKADRHQLEQVIMNLSINARDAMVDRGSITISACNTTLDESFCATRSWARPGRFIRLTVSDTGRGIAPENYHQVFDPFFTTKGVGKGTGLGLATVYGIVKQHKGFTDFTSRLGVGTSFHLYFPESSEARARPPERELPASGGTETILVAEDEEHVRSLIVRVLEDAGYTVIAAEDGNRAVSLFEEHGQSVSLALLDVVMPGMNGPEVYRQIHKLDPDIQVMLCSGYTTEDIDSDFIEREKLQFLNKPYSPHVLLSRIRELLDGFPGGPGGA